MGAPSVKQGASRASDEVTAVDELQRAIDQPDAGLVLFFCSSRYDLERLGAELATRFPCPVMGCTSAGEISAAGYQEGGIVGVSIATDALRVHLGLLAPLADEAAARALSEALLAECAWSSSGAARRFGLLVVDGLSVAEEATVAYLATHFGQMPIVGGSAGDDLAFRKTGVYWQGQFVSGAAVFCVVETTLPFVVFKTQAFEATDVKLVVTQADPGRRRVTEFDGDVAAEVYAETLGLTRGALAPSVFSEHPVLLRLGGENWVRAIQKVDDDGGVTFFCAIDNGIVLTLGKATDLVEDLRRKMREIAESLPKLALVLGYDCILRRLELVDKNQIEAANRVLEGLPFLGFSTYGEQFGALHINQTLTGVALGDPT